jgi:hypothetical protein
LSRIRVVTHEPAAPAAPPTKALPIKAAPPTTIGAILASGVEEKESSETIIIYYIFYFLSLAIKNNYFANYNMKLKNIATLNSL